MNESHWNALLFLFSLASLLALFGWNAFNAPFPVLVSELEQHTGEKVVVLSFVQSTEWRGSALLFSLDKNHSAILFSPSLEEAELLDCNCWLKVYGKAEKYKGQVELQVEKVERA
ncbi:MAG: hypothetical protein V1847_04965 [Candidatus Diapherotrites archaeon]